MQDTQFPHWSYVSESIDLDACVKPLALPRKELIFMSSQLQAKAPGLCRCFHLDPEPCCAHPSISSSSRCHLAEATVTSICICRSNLIVQNEK